MLLPGSHTQAFTTWHPVSTTYYYLIKSASFNRSIDLLLEAAIVTPTLLYKVVKEVLRGVTAGSIKFELTCV